MAVAVYRTETVAAVTAGENVLHSRLPEGLRSGLHTVSVSDPDALPQTFKLLIAH